MKHFWIILITLLMASPCYAFENYMLLADKQISKIKVSNESIITVEPIQTIYGAKLKRNDETCDNAKTTVPDRKAMMIIPHAAGCARLSFCKGKKRICLVVRVTENETCIKHVNGIKLVPMDLPPELK